MLGTIMEELIPPKEPNALVLGLVPRSGATAFATRDANPNFGVESDPKTGANPDPKTGAGEGAFCVDDVGSFVSSSSSPFTSVPNPKPSVWPDDAARAPKPTLDVAMDPNIGPGVH